MDVKGKHVFVGLSGGVDSAVTAALLQSQGALVTGVFIQGWYPPGLVCSWKEDRRDAMRVAAKLQIPFVTLDASVAYKKSVIDYLINSYREGKTPNPDIFCNKDVKFGVFYDYAMAHGASAIATGHYARVEGGNLLRGIDEGKDQSYFLWAVPRNVLPQVLMPLGGMKKEKVRRLAEEFALPTAAKKDSQGICFLGSVSIEDFLRNEIEVTEGEAFDEQGNNIGTHGGAVLYTLGERVGLTEAIPGPWYVVAKDLTNNTITVSKERHSQNMRKEIQLHDMNMFEDSAGACSAQYRYHGPRIAGVLKGNIFSPTEPLTEVLASGQSLVLYQDDQVLGGGIIS